jgi:outer membrane protein
MKNIIRKSILFIAVAVAVAMPASLQAQGKVATIDLRKVFDNYYKTKNADTQLKEEATEMEKQRKDMVDEYRKGDAEFKALIDKANDQAISADERSKNKAAADKKMAELKETEQAITEYERRSRSKLAEKQRVKREAILKEIRAVIDSKAMAGNLSLVIDVASESANGTPVVLYSNGENDITVAVLSQINATAPVLSAAEESAKTNAPATKVEEPAPRPAVK